MLQYIIAAAIIAGLAAEFSGAAIEALQHTKQATIEARQASVDELNTQLQPLGDTIIVTTEAEEVAAEAAVVELQQVDEAAAAEAIQSATQGANEVIANNETLDYQTN